MPLKYSTGIDLLYLPRLKDKLADDKFLNKVLTTYEYNLYSKLGSERRKLEYLGGRFAAKEAYSKAMKLGIGKISFHDFEVLVDENKAVYVKDDNISLSISHDNDYVIAIVIVGVENE